jgi:hypothetical protein
VSEEAQAQQLASRDVRRDRRQHFILKWLWSAVAFGLAVVFTTLSFHQAARLAEVNALIADRRHKLDMLTDQRNKVEAELATKIAELNKVRNERQALASVINAYGGKAPAKPQQRAARIIYFPKGVDGERVEAALKDLGFRVDKGNTTQGMSNKATNALFCGSQVTPDELKLVALALINGGVQLQTIRGARQQGPNVIQIGHSDRVEQNKLLTAQSVVDGTAFNSPTYVCSSSVID